MKTVLAAVFALALAACAGTTPYIDPARLGEVQKGKTTAADVERQFGKPSVFSRNTDGTQSATYVHGDRQSNSMTVVPLLATTPRDSVTFYFDDKGLLTNVTTTQANPGVAAQGNAATPANAATAAKPATSSNPAQSPSAKPATAGTSPSAPATGAQQSNSPSWRLPDWLPPPTTPNR